MSKKTYKFRLLGGTHREDGEFYTAVGLNAKMGDEMPIIESTRRLDEVYTPHRFELIHEDIEPSKPTKTTKTAKAADVEDDDDDDDNEEPTITLKAVKRKKGMWDVVKVIDGEETDEAVNDDFLSRVEALEMVEEGYSEEDDEE